MMRTSRRSILRAASASAGLLALPRFAIGQSENRSAITVAVQKISNSNTLEPMREQSNVGQRTSQSPGLEMKRQ